MDPSGKEPSDEPSRDDLSQKYNKLLAICKQAKQAKDEATKKLITCKETEQKLREELEVLQEVVQASADKQEKLAEADNKIKLLSSSNSDLIRKIEEIEAKNKALEKTVKQHLEKIEFLEERIFKDKDKLAEIDNEKTQVETLNKELSEKLKAADERYCIIEKSLADFKEKYLEEKKQYAKLETVLNKLEEKSEKSSSERSESRDGLQTVPESNEDVIIENEKYKTQIDQLLKEVARYQDELNASRSSYTQLETTYGNFIEKCCQQSSDLMSVFTTADVELQKIVTEKQSIESNLKDELMAWQIKFQDVTDQNELLKSKLEKTSAENDNVKMEEIAKFQKIIEDLKEEIKNLRQENLDADDKFTTLQNRLQESTQVSEKLEELVSNRCKEYDYLKSKSEAHDKIIPALQILETDATKIQDLFKGLKASVADELSYCKKDQKYLETTLLRDVEEFVKKQLDYNAEVLKEMNDMNQVVKERGETISKLEEMNAAMRNEIIEHQAELKIKMEQLQSAEGDVTSLRNNLEARERVIRDLEEEIIRVKGNETQVDTLSTSTVSKAEELQRLSELDQSFDERYNKLKVVAIKFKKQASDLQSQVDRERAKLNEERTEYQNAVTKLQNQISTLQVNNDALQNEADKARKELIDLQKSLKKITDENSQLKQSVDELKNSQGGFKHEKSSFEIIKKELTAQIQNQKKIIEKEQLKAKEWAKERERLELEQKEILKKLEDEKEKHKSVLVKLEAEKHNSKKQDLLNLEMADYERIVNEFKNKLDAKENQLQGLMASLDTQRELSATLQSTIAGLESRVSAEQATADSAKARQNALQEELSGLRQELASKVSQVADWEKTAHERNLDLDALKLENSNIAAENSKLEEKLRALQESTKIQLRSQEDKMNALKATLESRGLELDELKKEYDQYKVRATRVLRQTQPDGSLSKQQNIEEEVVHLRASCESLRTKLDNAVKNLQEITEDHEKAVEEKIRLAKKVQELQTDNGQLNARNAQLQAAEQKAREQYEESARLLPVQQETLAQCFKQQIEELEAKYRAELETVRAAQQQSEMALSLHVGRHTPMSHRRQPSTGPLDGHRRQPSSGFIPVKSERETLDVLMLEREACEGSESVESTSPKILPLEQLLSPQPAHNLSLDVSLLAEKLEKSESRNQHLTNLLSDAEGDAARLQQLNQVLKEEIRRKERNVAREEHSNNLEYLKNVVVKFGTLPRGDERLRLVPVLNTILKFSKEEEQKLYAAARGDSSAAGWGSYLGGMWQGTQ